MTSVTVPCVLSLLPVLNQLLPRAAPLPRRRRIARSSERKTLEARATFAGSFQKWLTPDGCGKISKREPFLTSASMRLAFTPKARATLFPRRMTHPYLFKSTVAAARRASSIGKMSPSLWCNLYPFLTSWLALRSFSPGYQLNKLARSNSAQNSPGPFIPASFAKRCSAGPASGRQPLGRLSRGPGGAWPNTKPTHPGRSRTMCGLRLRLASAAAPRLPRRTSFFFTAWGFEGV
mmetsp:Transcript_72148/g.181864  ORF Transcript_72148/g.181864 Transcript_72148/m.181864 type:complete len:234 (-) Transcript_72148:76-777(-)